MQTNAEEVPARSRLLQWCLRADAVAQCYIRDVLALRVSEPTADQDVFWWLGKVPCRSVRCVGMVVEAREYERRTMYTLDDGTGVIQCAHFRGVDKPKSQKQADPMLPMLALDDIPKSCYEVGDIVRVTGRVEKWHDSFQIVVNDLEPCRPNDEPDHWIATALLHETYYNQPFVIPPPPQPPRTPVKPASRAAVATSPRTATATPSTPASTSRPPTQVDGPVFLRHPSRLHSRDLISSTFKIYLKNYMDTLSDLSRTTPFSLSQKDHYRSTSSDMGSPTKRLKHLHHSDDNATPKPRDKRDQLWQEGEATSYISAHGEKENAAQFILPRRPKGFTLSYLRRVPELSDLAFRVVDAETKRRARETRRKEKEAHHDVKTRKPSKTNQSQPEPPGRKAKRLYTWAIRELYKEGSITLHDDDAPVWEIIATHDSRGVWKPCKDIDQGVHADDTASSNVSTHTSSMPAEEGRDEPSEPPTREESYIPITPALLTGPVIDTIRDMMVCKPRATSVQQTGTYRYTTNKSVGPTAEELREHMGRLDARWENTSAYAVADTLQLLKAQNRVYKIGKGRWEITL